MYERSAIVLENYFEKVLGLNKENNLKNNYENFTKLIEKIKEYQKVIEEEENVISKFDQSASEIQDLQNKQNKLHEMNVKVEEERNELFNDLGENTSTLDQKLKKIEDIIEKNNNKLKDLREEYIKTLIIFTERQRERNKYARLHRTTEGNYISVVKQVNYDFEKFNLAQIKNIKSFLDNHEKNCEEIIDIMLKNGRSERVPFDEQVIRKAVEERCKVAIEEAQLYLSVFERMKRLITEVNNGTIRLAKSEKLLRDVSVKLAFMQAKKDYIVVFLDNERMTAMNGKKAHGRLMEEACNNFSVDIKQIDNLYDLIIKETSGKATKKAYKELYNKTYLRDIEEKEKDFEEEAVNIKINMGTLINSNYWRIEGIKNIYNTFQEEVGEKFEKDLSEYRIDEVEEPKEEKQNKIVKKEKEEEEKEEEIKEEKPKTKFKIDNSKDEDEEEIDNYEEDDNYYDDEDFYDYDDYDDDDDEEDLEEDDDYEDVIFDDEEEADLENNDDNDDYDEFDDEFDDYYDEEYEDNEDDDDITEEKIDQIIKSSRKGKNKKEKEEKQEKGLFGKLFKK